MSKPQHVPGTFSWFECGTTDAAAAKKFYTAVFGWKTMDVPMPGEAGGHYTMFRVGDADIAGLYQMSGPTFAGVPAHWMTYVTVADVDASVKRARALGGTVLAEPMDVPGVGRIAVIQDPTGATISLFKPGEHPGAAQLGPGSGTFGWSELATRDTKAAKLFYTELLNWKAKEASTGPIQYTEFQVGETTVGGMMAMTPQHGDAPPHWLPYVMVADCDAITAKAKQSGGRVLVPPMDIPNVGRFSVFMDPTGAVLATVALAER